jgi:molybdopterin-biosynthesis enzyme MoeA-like protein
MTLQGLAMALHKKVVLNQKAVEMLKKSYSRRSLHYELTEARLKMAMIPQGSTPLQNPIGSAPAIMSIAQNSKTKIFCLPGVPSEMKAIFKENIKPLIKENIGRFVMQEINYNVRGVTEAMIAPELVNIVNSYPEQAIYLKTHPGGYAEKNIPQIRVQLISRGNDEREVKNQLNSISKTILKEVSKLGGKIVPSALSK